MFLDRLVSGFRECRSFVIPGRHPGDPALAELFDSYGPTRAGVKVNHTSALGLSAVWRAVNVRSMAMGSLPLFFYRRLANGGRERFSDHPAAWLHDVANSELAMTASTFQQLAQRTKLLWGNHVSWIERRKRDGAPMNLWPQPPDLVYLDETKSGALVYVFVGDRGPDKTYKPMEVLHFKGPSPDGLWGWSRIKILRESIGGTMAAQRFAAAYFGQGARMGSIITTLPGVKPEDALKMREYVTKQATGEDNWCRPVVVPGADKVTLTSVPAEDAQFLATQEFGVTEAARLFDVPLGYMGLPNAEPRANAEQGALDFVVMTLGPECGDNEQEIGLKFLDAEERKIVYPEYNLDALLRGDFRTRMEGHSIATGSGLRSVNDVARVENWNPISEEEGGDVRRVPVNTVNLKALVNQTEMPNLTPTPGEPEKKPVEKKSAVDWVAVYEPMFLDATARLVAKERKHFDAQIAKRGEDALTKESRAKFYAEHRESIRFAFSPSMQSLGGDESAIVGLVESYVFAAERATYPEWIGEGSLRWAKEKTLACVAVFKGDWTWAE